MNWQQIEEKANAWGLNHNECVLLVALAADPTAYLLNRHVEFVIQGMKFDLLRAVENLVRAEIIEVFSDVNGLAYRFLDGSEQSEQG